MLNMVKAIESPVAKSSDFDPSSSIRYMPKQKKTGQPGHLEMTKSFQHRFSAS